MTHSEKTLCLCSVETQNRSEKNVMIWNPELNEVCDDERPLPDGEYEAVVTQARECVSRAGNDMIWLKLLVDTAEHGKRVLHAHLLPLQQCLWKVMQFCDATGLSDTFDKGQLSSQDCQGLLVRVRVSNDDPNWDGSVVEEFVKTEEEKVVIAEATSNFDKF